MTEQGDIFTKTVQCRGGELFQALQQLDADGWTVGMMTVKGPAQYTLSCFPRPAGAPRADLRPWNERTAQ